MKNVQATLAAMLGDARFDVYLTEAGGDPDSAADLYRWATELSGVMHGQLSYVEVAVRNALDALLQDWNEAQGYRRDWTAENQAAPGLYKVMSRQLREARGNAARAAAERAQAHPRHGKPVTHADVLTQLTFGKWVNLIYNPRAARADRARLWVEVTHLAFAHSPRPSAHTVDSEQTRQTIGRQLDDLRHLRNRVAHHENLLSVNVKGRLGLILSMLERINPEYLGYVARQNPLRAIIKQDPRRQW